MIIIIIGFHQWTKTLVLHSTKHIVPCERTTQEVSFQWHYGHTIGFHHFKVKVPCKSLIFF